MQSPAPAPVVPPVTAQAQAQTVPATKIGRMAFGAGDMPTATVAFPADTAKISVFLELLTPAAGDRVEAKWIAVNTSGAAPGYVIDTSTTPVTAGVQNVVSGLTKPNAGWPLGDYKVDVSVNGQLATSIGFAVVR